MSEFSHMITKNNPLPRKVYIKGDISQSLSWFTRPTAYKTIAWSYSIYGCRLNTILTKKHFSKINDFSHVTQYIVFFRVRFIWRELWAKKCFSKIKGFFTCYHKQVRTNIGLADTLIPSSFIYLIYMGGTGPCRPMTIIFRSVI